MMDWKQSCHAFMLLGLLRIMIENTITVAIALLLTLQFLVRAEILRLPACSKFDGEFSIGIDAKVLLNSSFRAVREGKLEQCIFRCVDNGNCKSINFNLASKLCELNYRDRLDSNATFQAASGWSYYETPPTPSANIGPLCRTQLPCKHGKCRDSCELPGYICTCDSGYTGALCEKLSPGSLAAADALSCLRIRQYYGTNRPPSGFYWIGANDPVRMFCDMDTDGGGWTKVGHMNITSNSFQYSRDFVHDDVKSLSEVHRSFYYALSTSGLSSLRQLINFTSIRIYCYKPGKGSTVHMRTEDNALGRAVVDYMTNKVDLIPFSCGSYVLLADDNSLLSKHCDRWYADGRWSFINASKRDLLYDVTAFIAGTAHIITGNFESRFECDDYSSSDKIGTWMFYVR